MYVSIYLSIYLSISARSYLSILAWTYVSMYLCISACSYLSIFDHPSLSDHPNLFIYLSIYISLFIPTHLSLSIHLSICLSTFIFINLSLNICIYVSMYFSMFIFICLSICDNTPSAPREYINFFKPSQSWLVNHLVVPIAVSHISLWPQKMQSREWEKKNKEQTNNMASVSSKCKKRSYVILHSLCICRLTLAWISSEISTKLLGMPTHLDWSSLTAAGLYLMRLVSLLSGVDCPSASPFANSSLWVPSSNSLTGVPLPTSGCVEISGSGLCLVSRQNRQRDRLLSGPPI